jgi:hypothetical protein
LTSYHRIWRAFPVTVHTQAQQMHWTASWHIVWVVWISWVIIPNTLSQSTLSA